MYGEERQQLIIQMARDAGRVGVASLAERLDVTAETIRRDLSSLERQGVLRRVHGGAIPVERLGFEPEIAARAVTMTAEKELIAKAALAELPAEGSVFIEAGSTPARLAELLPYDRELTVVTNAIATALSLAHRHNLTVMTVGGRIRSRSLAEVDDWALRSLASLYVDVAFLGTNGLSVDRGLTTPDPSEAALKRATLLVGRRRVLLADHTKVGRVSLCRYGDLNDVDVVITDSGLSDEEVDDLEQAGPVVVRA
ncbi:MAG: DeoR/GlpR family DNA-binding transcription regulator [Acidimicrobiales bacterium]